MSAPLRHNTDTMTAVRPATEPTRPDLADAREAAERRRFERKPYICEAWVASPTSVGVSDRDGDSIEVTSVNLSRHGVAFRSPRALPCGTFFRIHIGIGPQQIKGEIRVLRCDATGDDDFEIGAEFC